MNQQIRLESTPNKSSVLFFIFLLFSFAYLWQPITTDISSSTAIHALAAEQFALGENLSSLSNSRGMLIDFPLYSIILGFIRKITPLTDFLCTVPVLLAILVTTIISGFTASRSSGHLSNITVSSIIISTTTIAYQWHINCNYILAMSLLTLAWIILYRANRIYNLSWTIVWIITLLPVFLAILAIGLKAIVIFYIPLFFMRRPLKIAKRILQLQHILPLIAYIFLIYFSWNYLMGGNVYIFREATQALSLPLLIIYFLTIFFPWYFLAWPIYCHAFLAVERTPIFNQYIRTILSFSFILLICAGKFIDDLVLFIPLFAICAAVNYEIFIRRYYLQTASIIRFISLFPTVLLLLASTFLLISKYYHQELPFNQQNFNIFILTAVIAQTSVFFFKYLKNKIPYSCRIAIILVSCVVSANTGIAMIKTNFPYSSSSANLVKEIPTNQTIYLLSKDSPNQALYYLKRPIKKLRYADDLPSDQDRIFVITENEAPILERFEWTSISTEIYPDGKQIALWQGNKRPEIAPKK